MEPAAPRAEDGAASPRAEDGAASPRAEDGAASPRADHRRNTLAYLGDYLFFGVGMSFTSQATVLPSLVRALSGSALLVGLVSAIATGGWLLPQLFTANLVAGKPRLKTGVLVPAVTGRASLLLLPPALLLLAPRSPGAALAVFFAIHTLFWVTDGLTTVGWLDLMGRLLTAPERARLIGTGMAASGVLGIGVGIAVTAVLGSPRLPFPASYAVLFAGAGAAYLLAALSFLCVRETPHAGGQPPLPWRAYFRELAGLLRGDHDLRRVVVTQLVLGSCGLALPYYVLFGLDRLAFPASAVGVFTAFQVAGGIAGGLGMGRLAERRGSRSVMRLWAALTVATPLAALAFPALAPVLPVAVRPYLYAVVFLVVGAQGSSTMNGFVCWVMEYAPPSRRPMYIGFANALSGTSLVMPILGGLLLTWWGYPLLFAAAAAAALAGLLLALRTAEPRHRAAAGAAPATASTAAATTAAAAAPQGRR